VILTLDRLEDIEHAKFRAMAQIQIDKKAGIEAFEDYMKIAFPSLAARRKARDQELIKVLQMSAAGGPLQVTPLEERKIDSRVKRIMKEQ
jgi:hypothetical protein